MMLAGICDMKGAVIMRILLTGATGFVGSRLVPKLICDHEVCVLARDIEKAKNSCSEKANFVKYEEKGDGYVGAVRSFDPQVVVHLASLLTSGDDRETLKELLDSNIYFTAFLLDSLRSTSVKYFINTGSSTEYCCGNGKLDPAYLYSATKIACRSFLDYYSRVYGFTYVNVIPYSIYGGKSRSKKAIDHIFNSLMSREPVEMTSGAQVMDLIHVDDVVSFYLSLIDNLDKQDLSGKDLHLGSGNGVSLKELAVVAEKVSNLKTNIKWGAKKYRPRDVMYSVAPVGDIKKELNWSPKISLEEGVRRYWDETRK